MLTQGSKACHCLTGVHSHMYALYTRVCNNNTHLAPAQHPAWWQTGCAARALQGAKTGGQTAWPGPILRAPGQGCQRSGAAECVGVCVCMVCGVCVRCVWCVCSCGVCVWCVCGVCVCVVCVCICERERERERVRM